MEEELNKNDLTDSQEDDDSHRQSSTGRSIRDTRKYFDDSSDNDDEEDEKPGIINIITLHGVVVVSLFMLSHHQSALQ